MKRVTYQAYIFAKRNYFAAVTARLFELLSAAPMYAERI